MTAKVQDPGGSVGRVGCQIVALDESERVPGRPDSTRFCELATQTALARRARIEGALPEIQAAYDGLDVEGGASTRDVGLARARLLTVLQLLDEDVFLPLERVSRDDMVKAAMEALDRDVYGGNCDGVSLFQQAVAVADAWHGGGWIVLHLEGQP